MDLRELRDSVRSATAVPVPGGSWAQIVARRAAGESVILPTEVSAPLKSGRLSLRIGNSGIRAAALVAGLAGIASATLPGSPVRGLWDRVIDPPEENAASNSESSRGGALAPLEAVEPMAGITVSPVAGEIQITFESPDSAVQIRVRLTDRERVEVEARGAAAGAVLRSGTGRITIEDAGAGEILIAIPRTTRLATIRIDGETYFVKDGAEIRILVPDAAITPNEFVLPVRR